MRMLSALLAVVFLSACSVAQNAAINIGAGIAMDRSLDAINNMEDTTDFEPKAPDYYSERPGYETSEDYCEMYPQHEGC